MILNTPCPKCDGPVEGHAGGAECTICLAVYSVSVLVDPPAPAPCWPDVPPHPLVLAVMAAERAMPWINRAVHANRPEEERRGQLTLVQGVA